MTNDDPEGVFRSLLVMIFEATIRGWEQCPYPQ